MGSLWNRLDGSLAAPALCNSRTLSIHPSVLLTSNHRQLIGGGVGEGRLPTTTTGAAELGKPTGLYRQKNVSWAGLLPIPAPRSGPVLALGTHRNDKVAVLKEILVSGDTE